MMLSPIFNLFHFKTYIQLFNSIYLNYKQLIHWYIYITGTLFQHFPQHLSIIKIIFYSFYFLVCFVAFACYQYNVTCFC